MQKILRKRVLRDLKANALRYLALSLLIVLSMYLIVSLVGAAETVINRVDELGEGNHLEDGQFTTFIPLTQAQQKQLEDEGAKLEEMFYLDYNVDESTLRVFKNRKELNLLALDAGHLAEKTGEVVLEKQYCQENDLTVGDWVKVGGENLKIVGIGSVPDYDAPYKELSDSSVDSQHFGLAFVGGEQYDILKKKGGSSRSESYTYAYFREGTVTDDEIKETLKNFDFSPEAADNELVQKYSNVKAANLTEFITVSDNFRIKASSADQVINKVAGLIAGFIVLILFSYVISVFTIHNIEEESSVIGALYALGAKKKELIIHYLTLPVMVTVISGIVGTCLGFSRWGLEMQLKDCYDYFSIPKLAAVYPVYLLIYGIFMPPLTAVLVNYLVMNKKLSRTALSLLRKEHKTSRFRNIELKGMGFMGRFRIRHMLREARSTGTVIMGMFISLLILLLGINCYVMCIHISTDNKKDTKYEYMYTYKYPEETVPDKGEEGYAVTLKKENLGYELDVTLLGIHSDNPYFDASVSKGQNKILLSSAAAQKFGLKSGEQVIFTDQENDRDYAFTIEGTTQYSPALYVFMDIDSMRSLFGMPEDYYNVVFSQEALDIEPDRLYAVTSKADIEKSSNIFVDMMMPMIYMMTAVAVLVFFVVMYLMMKVMIDRSAMGISLFKIFGYRTKEIRKLYLNGNFYGIAVGGAICLPLAKTAMDAMYPVLVANVACVMDLRFSWRMYIGIYGGIIVLYLVINRMLVGRLRKMTPAEILKERE